MFCSKLILDGCIYLRINFRDFIRNELPENLLLITCGLPGTWKTETSQEISKIKGYPILRIDLIRLEVLKNEDIFDVKVAGNMSKREMVYNEMFRQAENFAKKEKAVILDATFVTKKLRNIAAEVAAKTNIPFFILQTQCSEEKSISRILKRTKENYVSNALTKEAYIANQKNFEQIDLNRLKKNYPKLEITHLKVDTEFDDPENWYIISKIVK